MTEISGAVAVVTGGAAGIGRGIAEELMAAGATVVIADIEQARLEATAAEIGADAIRVDVADAQSVQALADEVIRRHGSVEILVNNAGVGPMSKIADLTLGDWKWMLDINLYGVIHGVSAFLPHFIANERPTHIVNTGSMAAFAPNSPLGAYSVSKAGVWALTETLAQEMEADRTGVGVTLLAPGNVHSDISTSQRNRPDQGALRDIDLAAQPATFTRTAVWLTPRQAGAVTVRAIRNDDRYAITHPGLWSRVEERYERLRDAFDRYPALAPEAAPQHSAAEPQK